MRAELMPKRVGEQFEWGGDVIGNGVRRKLGHCTIWCCIL